MATPQSFPLIASSEIMRSILARIDTIAASDSTVLLIGETGVGKELMAEYLHRTSPRSGKPFVKVALSSLPPELLENELFGHEKGAYTTALNGRRGPFEIANTGTIFLDDIDDLPLHLQTKLLQVLESQELKHVGGTASITVDVRFITATKVNLMELVDRGLFRSDLYYRINVVPITIPPLRERREDVAPLVEYYLQRYSPDRRIVIRDDAMRMLMNYSWPGNVRELKNIMQRISLLTKDEVHSVDLPPEAREDSPVVTIAKACTRCFAEDKMSFDEVMTCLEVNLLRHALRQTSGNRSRAAKALGMSPSTLRDKLKKHNL
jgi:transcriptional regulator with GAF, ATPase, and Fis domain